MDKAGGRIYSLQPNQLAMGSDEYLLLVRVVESIGDFDALLEGRVAAPPGRVCPRYHRRIHHFQVRAIQPCRSWLECALWTPGIAGMSTQ